jgi:chaperonin GroES
MKLRPISNQVVIKKDKPEEKTKGGIIIPEVAQTKTASGEVRAVGPGWCRSNGVLEPMTVAPGDRVIFGKFDGYDVTIDGEDYHVTRLDAIQGVEEA